MRKVLLGQLVVIVGVLGGAALAHADPFTPPGVKVFGYGSHFYSAGACTTCPNVGDSSSDGAADAASAVTQSPPAPYIWFASAEILNGTYLPELKAYAASTNPQGSPDYFSFWVSASASAQGLQRFTYTGTEQGTYTISYTVDGAISGDDESINAGLNVFGGNYIPALEHELQNTELGGGGDSYFVSAAGSFTHTGSVTFSILPDEAFYISTFLSANTFWTDETAEGVADASHTLTSTFTAGNTSLLRPGLLPTAPVQNSIPEPATMSLLLVGLATATSAMRRARRQ